MKVIIDNMNGRSPSPETMSQQFITYTDDSLATSVLSGLDTLRQAGELCDCVLRVGHKSAEFAAHQAVLASISPFFMSAFEQYPRHEVRRVYSIKHVSADIMQILLDYTYTGRLKFTQESLMELYNSAKLLKFHNVCNICVTHMMKSLDLSNCFDVRTCVADNSQLCQQVNEFIQRHLPEIEGMKSFQSLPQIKMRLLGHDRGSGPDPATVAKLVSDWLLNSSVQIQDGVLKTDGSSQSNGSRTDSQVLTEHDNVLWLDDDNHLHDVTSMDADIIRTDVVQDYVKVCKKRSRLSSHVFPEVSSTDNSRTAVQIIAFEKVKDCVYRILLDICGSVHLITVRIQTVDKVSNDYRRSSSSRTNSTVSSQASSSTEDDEQQPGLDHYLAPNMSTYEPLADMTVPRCGVGLAALDGQLIALGGNDRGECLSTVESYDALANQWTELPSMSCPRGRFECAVLDGQVYACGGSDGKRDLNSVECFDGSHWKSVPNMMSAKLCAGIGVLHHKLYVIGGYSGQRAEKSCEVYDSVSKQWSTVSSLNEGRSQAAVCSHNGLIYAFGGTDSWNCFNTVEAYDPRNDHWRFMAYMTQARRGAGAAVFRGKIYVVGGSDGTKSLASVEIYDPETNTWSLGPQLQTPRANAGVAVLGGCLYVSGGYGKNEFLSSLEILGGDHDSQWCSYLRYNRGGPSEAEDE